MGKNVKSYGDVICTCSDAPKACLAWHGRRRFEARAGPVAWLADRIGCVTAVQQYRMGSW